MDTITLGEIGLLLGFVAALVASFGTIGKVVQKAVKKAFEGGLKPTNDKIDKIEKKVEEVDLNTCKNFLVARLSEIEQGINLDSVAEERFWEQYEHYLAIGGNTYIQHKVEQLEKDGKL
jgi:hypothetical protein